MKRRDVLNIGMTGVAALGLLSIPVVAYPESLIPNPDMVTIQRVNAVLIKAYETYIVGPISQETANEIEDYVRNALNLEGFYSMSCTITLVTGPIKFKPRVLGHLFVRRTKYSKTWIFPFTMGTFGFNASAFPMTIAG